MSDFALRKGPSGPIADLPMPADDGSLIETARITVQGSGATPSGDLSFWGIDPAPGPAWYPADPGSDPAGSPYTSGPLEVALERRPGANVLDFKVSVLFQFEPFGAVTPIGSDVDVTLTPAVQFGSDWYWSPIDERMARFEAYDPGLTTKPPNQLLLVSALWDIPDTVLVGEIMTCRVAISMPDMPADARILSRGAMRERLSLTIGSGRIVYPPAGISELIPVNVTGILYK